MKDSIGPSASPQTRRIMVSMLALLSLMGAPVDAATWTVCGPAGVCDFTTIQGAIDDASVVNGDRIEIDADTFVETITIHKDLTLVGAGEAATTLVSGGGSVVTVSAGVTASVRRLTVTGGVANKGGGIYNSGTLTLRRVTVSTNQAFTAGGGIWTEGGIVLRRVTISDNRADDTQFGTGGGIFIDNILGQGAAAVLADRTVITDNRACSGGGVYNSTGRVFLRRSTVSDNSAILTAACAMPFGEGGGILNLFTPNLDGRAAIVQSTVSGNHADDNGGGIATLYGGTAILTLSTVSGNDAGTYGGGIYVNDFDVNNSTVVLNNATVTANASGTALGDAVHSSGSVNPGDPNTLVWARNSILSDQLGGATDCFGINTSFLSDGFNIEGGTSCGFVGEQQNTSPGLAPLAANGGPTETHSIAVGSPAHNMGNNVVGCMADMNGDGVANRALPVDQRGAPHVGVCDVGAFELQ